MLCRNIEAAKIVANDITSDTGREVMLSIYHDLHLDLVPLVIT